MHSFNDILTYHPQSGLLFFKAPKPEWFSSHNAYGKYYRAYAYKPAFNVPHSNGYLRGEFMGNSYYAHRVIWEMHHGAINKDMQIDHISGNKADNRLHNLRLATNSENQCNKGLQVNNTTGFKGVYIDTTNNRYLSYIRKDDALQYLGTFPDAVAAALAYDDAALGLHGAYAVTNKALGLV